MNYLVAVHTFFPDRPTGSARVAWDIAQLMRDRGENVSVFCRKQAPDDEEVSVHDGVRVVRFAAPASHALDPCKMHKQKTAGVQTLRRHLADIDWDVIHTHSPLFGMMVREAFGKGPRYVCTVHSPIVLEQEIVWGAQGLPGKIKLLFGRGRLATLERKVLSQADRIHTLSQFTKRVIDADYGIGAKITVIPHWCRPDFFREHSKEQARAKLGWSEETRILFTVRRLATRMGLDVAIEAVAPLLRAHDDLVFAIAGAGPSEQLLKALARSWGVQDKVWFLGRVSDDMLKRCYEAADLFVLPTKALECFGLILLEAFAYGLPVISSDAGAVPELMTPILPNCIVPAGDVVGLKRKLASYVEGNLSLPSPDTLVNYCKEGYGADVIGSRIFDLLVG